MSNLVNGWYKCTKSNEKNPDGSWAWVEGRYYYFVGGRTEDERGAQRPNGTFPLFLGSNGNGWLKACHLIPAAWADGCPVKLKDGRTGKITNAEEGKYIHIQLDDEYAIPSFVQVTPNEFEVITPEKQVLEKMAEQLRRFNEGLQKFGTLASAYHPYAFEIPEVGQLVRDNDDLSVWRVEEVTIEHICTDSEPHHYVELRRMDIIRAPWTSNLMRHETCFYDFWDHYEKWSDDMGFTGMFFATNGRVRTVYNGRIQGSCTNGGSCRYKDLDEIRKYVDPNAIEVDATTYCKQKDPAEDWFTGYAICVSDGSEDHPCWHYPITIGKIYRMEKGRFRDDANHLNNCTPEEFKKCFKQINEIFA